MTESVPQEVVDKLTEKINYIENNMPKIDTSDERKEAQIALADKPVDIKNLKSQLKDIEEEKGLPSEIDQLKEELKATQMTNEALKGVLGEFIKFTEAFLPEIEKTAGQHQSFFQMQQMVMVGKMLAGEPMPENIKKELEKK